jgi:hypothetical protein
MSRSVGKSVVVCLFIACLTAPAFGAPRDGREGGGGVFAAIKRAIIHILDANDLSWPKP